MELYSVIKNDGPGDILAWKFMGEDFNNNSQLIVSEAEEAVFIKDGVAVQVFDGGKYTLNSNNYPFISNLRNMMSAGVSSFNCKVYFINKAHRLELYWGTDSPIQLRDPVHRLQTSIRARGSYSIKVTESKKFLIKLIGNNIQSFTKEELNHYFRSAFLMFIKDKIAQVIVDSGREILDIATEKTTIATALHPALDAVMDEYGVRVVNFYISDISIPENDPSYEKLNKAYADRAVMGILGQDWGRQQAANILGDMANNPGAGGGVAAAGAGMGMGLAAGGAFGGLANQMFAPMAQNVQTTSTVPQTGQDGSRSAVQSDMVNCPSCGTKNSSTAKFCNECGHKILEGKIKCPNCGADMPENAKFCNECGTKM
jgi:membrane protease subunit (stomatin/prohibitin family)